MTVDIQPGNNLKNNILQNSLFLRNIFLSGIRLKYTKHTIIIVSRPNDVAKDETHTFHSACHAKYSATSHTYVLLNLLLVFLMMLSRSGIDDAFGKFVPSEILSFAS